MRFDRQLMIGFAAVLALAFSAAPTAAARDRPDHDKVVAAVKADQDGGGRKVESASRQARFRRHRSDRQWRLQPDRVA
jgi:hypothetical protein